MLDYKNLFLEIKLISLIFFNSLKIRFEISILGTRELYIVKVDEDRKNIMLMCCERDYKKCHRLTITNYLEENGFKKFEHLGIGDFD